MNRHTFTPLVAALLLAGCASQGGIAPTRSLADATAPDMQRSITNTPVTQAAWPTEQWWQAYGDAQLDALVDKALRDSPTLAIAEARARKAAAQAELADAARGVEAGLTGQVSGVHLPESMLPPSMGGGEFKMSYVFGTSIKYAPDIWGGKRAQWEAALGNARAAEVDAQAARTLLASNIVRTWLQLAQAHALATAAEADVQRNDALAGLQRQRANAGIDNRIVLEQTLSAEAAARQQRLAALQQAQALRNALALLTGDGPDGAMSITAPALSAMPSISVPEQLPSGLLARRADVVAARWRAEAALKNVDVARTQFYPSVNLSAMVGLVAGRLGDLFGTEAMAGLGGPAISLPIFQGDRLRANLKANSADADAAIAFYEQTVLGAAREVVDAVQAARSLDAQIAQAQASHATAKRAWELMQLRRKAGLATGMDVLNAQKPLLQLDQQLVQLQSRRRIAHADLMQALGGGIALPASTSTSASASNSNSTSTPSRR